MWIQVRLNPAESSDVLKRWAEHLCSPQVNQKSKAILVLLSLGCFYRVGEMLHRWELKQLFFTNLGKVFIFFYLKWNENDWIFLSLIESANRRVQINMQIHKHVFCFCTTAHNCSNYFSAPRFSTVFSQCKIFLFFQKTLSNYQWKWSCSLCLDFTNRECFMINLIYKWYLIFVSRAGRYLLMFDMNSPPSPPPAFSFSLTFPPSLPPSFHLLSSMRQFDRAALFVEACLKYGVMEANDSSNILFVQQRLYAWGQFMSWC